MNKPKDKDYGYYYAVGFDDLQSGWTDPDMEKKFYEDMKLWENEQKQLTIIVKPEEFGLDLKQGEQISNSFAQIVAEKTAFNPIYEQLIGAEITPTLCKMAADAAKKLMKMRTTTDKIHKANKLFFLNGGRFVDSIKNKLTVEISEMEKQLELIARYYENLEQERLAKLKEERTMQCSKFTSFLPQNIELMLEADYSQYLQDIEIAYNAKIEAAKKEEEERLAKLEEQRLENERIRIENERIRLENELLKKEAAEKEAAAKLESEKAAKALEIERKKQAVELAAQKAEADRIAKIEADKRAKIEAELRANAELDCIEKENLQKEIVRQQKEKERIELESIAAEKKAQNAPDKEKLLKLAKQLEVMQLPELTGEDAKKVLHNTSTLMIKVVNYIKEQTEKL